MPFRYPVAITAFLLWIVPASAQNANLAPPTSLQVAPITLEECVQRALDKNFDLRIQRFTTENAKESLTIAKAGFDPTLSAIASKSISQSSSLNSTLDDEGNILTTSRNRSDAVNTRLQVDQTIVTGATVSAQTNLDRSKNRPTRSRLDPAYDSDVSLSVRQPLLRGAGIAQNRSAIDRAKLGVTRANYDFKGTVLDVIRRVETAYYNLAFSREQLGVRRFSLQVAQKLLEENQAKKNTGVATDLDVLLAEVGVANARRSLLLAEQTVRDREDVLLSLINPFQFDTPLGPISLADDPVLTVSYEHSYKLARENDPDYASTQANIDQLKIDERVARRNKLPSLSVGGGVGYNAREGSAGRAISNVSDRDGYDYTFDVRFSMPWGLRADRARYRQSVLTLNQTQARLEALDQSIVVDVRAAVRAVQTSQESVTISALATQLSQRQFDLEKARYDAGLSTFRRVQESQEQLDTARVDELQAKVNLRNALADLARLEGSSLTRYKIKVDS
jgi:outer membrane protein